MNSALYHGFMQHRRHRDTSHAFRYPIFMVYLDLDELTEVFRGRWFWSVERFNLASFRRRDYLGEPTEDLKTAVQTRVAGEIGRRPDGAVRMLTHLSSVGLCFNPVTFYYLYDRHENLEAVAAEITNTPWGERHTYVLDVRSSTDRGRTREWGFEKAFHISPFFGMDQRYRWRLSDPSDRLSVYMQNTEDGTPVFDASLALERRPMTAGNMAKALIRHPAMTLAVHTAIYFQALRLWLRGARFHVHPAKQAAMKTRTT